MPSTEPQSYRYTRTPFLAVAETPGVDKETYGGRSGRVFLEGHHLSPDGVANDTVCIFMHPTGVLNYLPMPIALAKAGLHVMCCASRYPHDDSALIVEHTVVDLGAVVRHARERLGFERVVLCGWSGGGALSLLYQQQAVAPTITHTPAGDPADLTAADLIPADAVMLLAPHLSRSRTLAEWIDPSVVDEDDPLASDPALDIYADDPPETPPYSAKFLERYEQAQVARMKRIDTWVLGRLQLLKDIGLPHRDEAFTVHRTMAFPGWLDPAVDTNDRGAGQTYLGQPEQVNHALFGLARHTSLRSWLSQWSLEHSRADGEVCGRDVAVPVLVVENSADDACVPRHTRALYEAVGSADKEMATIDGANHYYFDQKDELADAVATCRDWLQRHDFVDGPTQA